MAKKITKVTKKVVRKKSLPRNNVKSLLRSLDGRNVHLENLDGDTYNGMLQVVVDGVMVGNHPFAIDLDNVKSVREI